MVAVVGVSSRKTDAIGDGVGVAIGVEADELGEGAGLCSVMMLLKVNLRKKLSFGPSAVKLVIKRWRTS